MKDSITPADYEALSEDDQCWYAPEYQKYLVRKYRDYQTCDLGCEHYMGWKEVSIPVGDPFRYVKVDVWQHYLNIMSKLMQPTIIDSINSSNVLMNRILKRK